MANLFTFYQSLRFPQRMQKSLATTTYNNILESNKESIAISYDR